MKWWARPDRHFRSRSDPLRAPGRSPFAGGVGHARSGIVGFRFRMGLEESSMSMRQSWLKPEIPAAADFYQSLFFARTVGFSQNLLCLIDSRSRSTPVSTMHWSRLSPSASGLLVSWASSRTWTLKPLFRLTISATAPRVTTRSPAAFPGGAGPPRWSWRLLVSTTSLALRPQPERDRQIRKHAVRSLCGFPASHFRIRCRRWGPRRRYRRCNVGSQRFFDRIGDFVGVREQLTDLP